MVAAGVFKRLAPPLQRALWGMGWKDLRDVQAEALPLILDTQRDVIVSAATASGKTEAAFLPLLTRLWHCMQGDVSNDPLGVVLYVAPVKALINDQAERLQALCDDMDIPIYPWHGDVGQASRKRFLTAPRGVVLITPESLEALLFRRGAEVRSIFSALEAVVVDELHAFIGNVRGRQLQSLLHRLDGQLGRRTQRIGLSATLGDMGLAADFLRPGHGTEVRVLVSAGEKRHLQLALKAIRPPPAAPGAESDGHWRIADELFERLRGANYLVFPAGVGMVEFYADALRKRCEQAGLPVSFFPHHGRLAKSEREETESELKRGSLPVSAICTTTLEMGIDIGAIKGVVQIEAPQTVSSLCQRIGRAGRRAGDVAVLWQYCLTHPPGPRATGVVGLELNLLQAIAVIRLYLAKWYEPPRVGALDYSTLVQQLLSLIGECHGVTAASAYERLCQSGPFKNISDSDFILLLRAMASKELLVQDANRLLLHGRLGERLVSHYTFYAAFPDSNDYRLRQAGKALGTLPLPADSQRGDVITFAGRRWSIQHIDHEKRLVDLQSSGLGKLPKTGGKGQPVHKRVREEIRAILTSHDTPVWLDETAKSLLQDARRQYVNLQLGTQRCVVEGDTVFVFLWEGDVVQNALAALLMHQGLFARNEGHFVMVQHATLDMVTAAIGQIAAQPCPQAAQILHRKNVPNSEKWDWVLPDDLFFSGYASRSLALEEAHSRCAHWLSGH